MHISELAQHHVENPREVVSQGDAVNVLILEVDAERAFSLSLKRVEEGQSRFPRRRRRVGAPDAEPGTSPRRPPGGRGRGGSRGVERRGRAEDAAPESDAAAEVELEVETTADAEVAGGRRARRRADGRVGRCSGRRARDPARSLCRAPQRSRSPAESAPARARRSRVSEGGRRDRLGDEIVHHLPRGSEREAVDRPRAWRRRARRRRHRRPQARRRGRLRATARSSTSSSSCSIRSFRPSTCAGASRLASLPNSAPGLRHRGTAALRHRGEKRFDKVVVITAPAKLRRAAAAGDARRPRPAAAAGQGEDQARRLHLRQHGQRRGARRLGRRRHGGRRREIGDTRVLRPLVAAFAVYVLETEPRWHERLRYPLRYEEIVVGHAENYSLDPQLVAAVIYQESKFEADAVHVRRGRPDAAAPDRPGNRRPDRRRELEAGRTCTTRS